MEMMCVGTLLRGLNAENNYSFEVLNPSAHSKIWIAQFWFNFNWLIGGEQVSRLISLKPSPRLELRTLADYGVFMLQLI
jgi:hypothetical protein